VSPESQAHGTAISIGDAGLLVRGPSGAGKSLLALQLLDEARARGETAFLVSDDRVDLIVAAGRVQMRGPAAIAGLIELRGRGIVQRPHVESAPLALVVDLVPELVRMPEEAEFLTAVCGRDVPRCPVPRRGVVDAAHQVLLVREALRALRTGQEST